MKIPALIFDEGGWCEELKTSYRPGTYTPATKEEFEALAPFARKPVAELALDEDDIDREALVNQAFALKVLGPNAKPAARTVLVRWSPERLQTAIAEAEKALATKARAEAEAKALELKLGTPEEISALTDEDLETLIKAEA